ncbi:MAG: hypothetical protein U9N52_12485 [Campylobacterota bacterium]|nr:hypothetical protein [Campylobacterota bacterium]
MQNENDFIPLIEPTPIIHSKPCKVYTWLLMAALKSANPIAALLIWYRFDYFFAIASFLIGFVIMGIVRSKLRNSVIPLSQQEYHYSDDAIARWFMARRVCLEAND